MILKVGIIRDEIRTLFPIAVGALIPISFGMMLGWASPAYPFLLNQTISPIELTLDQSSLVAGFLLEGNSFGAFIMTTTIIPCKLAICFCYILQIGGWIIMYYSKDMYWFLASRMLVGFANSYGLAQLKRYIMDTCSTDWAAFIAKYMPLNLNIGIIVVYILGSLVSFREMCLYSTIVPIVGLAIFTVIPKKIKATPPAELKLPNPPKPPEPWHVFKVLRDKPSLKLMFLLFLMVFIQQYTGGPAHMVYSHLIYEMAGNKYPKLCACIYSIVCFITMLLAIKYTKDFNRKNTFLLCSGICILCLSMMSIYFYAKNELIATNRNLSWAPLFILIIYNFFHTFSYGMIPLLLIQQNFPKPSMVIANKFWTIHFSMSAALSTKVYQVIFTRFGMPAGYALFVGVMCGSFIAFLFLDDTTPKPAQLTQQVQPAVKEEKFVPKWNDAEALKFKSDLYRNGLINGAYVNTETVTTRL